MRRFLNQKSSKITIFNSDGVCTARFREKIFWIVFVQSREYGKYSLAVCEDESLADDIVDFMSSDSLVKDKKVINPYHTKRSKYVKDIVTYLVPC